MNRRESILSSSSSRRDTLQENHQPKNIGCMSGIFHLVSKYSHRRKFLTSGKKQERSVIASPPKPKQLPQENEAHHELVTEKTPPVDWELRRFSCDVQRSPTIPSEIRRSSSINSPGQFRRSPALVAKLMGLNDVTIAESPSPVSSADKRRKLLEALEKCDEDLKSLKKIIEAVRSYDHLQSSPAKQANAGEEKSQASPRPITKQSSEGEVLQDQKLWSSDETDGGDSVTNEKKCSDFSTDRPSPVSVLDGISSSPSLSCRRANSVEKGEKYGRKQREENTNLSFFHRITLESLPRFYFRRGDEYLISSPTMKTTRASSYWSSKAKIESVIEVCEDALWEERWELGRIGVILEDYMLGDLIEETVRELGYCHHMLYALPFEACKRKLCF